MKAEVVAVGSELVSGEALDTNSQWLSRQLSQLGIAVHWHTVIADDLAENVQAFAVAGRRADLVLVTGGLGPTQDDLTREALARLAGVELRFDEESSRRIEQFFAERQRPMPQRNRVQAMFPVGGQPLANTVGTAPGIWLDVPRSALLAPALATPIADTSIPKAANPNAAAQHSGASNHAAEATVAFVALPGVPREMREMFEREVRPRLAARFPAPSVIVTRKINLFGAGESAIEEKILDLTQRGNVPEVGITVSDITVSLRIRAAAADVTAAERLIEPTVKTIHERLGNLVFGEGDDELHDVVARMLHERRQTVAVAESLTGGLIGYRLTLVPGVSENFMGGICAYDNRIKRDLLGVPAEVLEKHGAVSAETAEAMAMGCRTRFGVDWAISSTGIAGPGGATPGKPVGLVYLGLAWAGGVKSVCTQWFGTREEIQSRSAKTALNLLRLELLRTTRQ